ncbi:MAG: alcohol dehydrogenase catalytic domain-containing protein [Acidibacillus sp.]|uniref:Starvation-sensing protein RspB n=1 Tax=Sulfoacidibacillus ferrooxidans TaxID=2005001 RepID=A0A9X1V7C3_9BACL|nr:alcohol dehydrogenase catalytic domain-containing protein [Sulfoacidibacillus ferrooxidans]MCI0182344.1 Starvation-sensing protein RspB [Sulfoacidibacillus ferrooxidans]MCY0892772.1 alcohol dehydrogenase catalytic domain-containing protein [Acidibacillus sp.]
MKAIVYDFSITKYMAAKTFGKRYPKLYYGKRSALSLREWPDPKEPGPHEIRMRPLLAGICGTDMGAILYKSSPSLTPFNSFPAVLGHEVVGMVDACGAKVKGIEPGQRISVDPFISCAVRGIDPPCPACAQGLHAMCHYSGTKRGLSEGMLMGFCRDLPGAFSEQCTIHESMAIPVPREIPDRLAVMIEPLSVGVHAVLRKVPEDGESVLVIGGGMIAYSVITALRMANKNIHITHLSLLPYQRDMAMTLGATQAFTTKEELLNDMEGRIGAKKHRPAMGRTVYLGGYAKVYDCIGSEQSLADALHYTRERGAIIVVGTAGHMSDLDWTFVWAKELSIIGSVGYGRETWEGETVSTHAITLQMLMQQENAQLVKLVTHEYSLDHYEQAIIANIERAKYQSIKTVFTI